MAITISWCRLSTSCFLYSRWFAEVLCLSQTWGRVYDWSGNIPHLQQLRQLPIHYLMTWRSRFLVESQKRVWCFGSELNPLLEYTESGGPDMFRCIAVLDSRDFLNGKSCREAFTCIHLRGWQKIPQNMKDSTSSTTMIPNHLGWCASIFEEGVISFAILTCFCPCQSSL